MALPKAKKFTCIACGKRFRAYRRTALYCSDACRQRQYRERKKARA